MRRPRRPLALLWTSVAALAAAVTAPAETLPDLAVPNVPYLTQTDSLCGGAALAMVLRYWGDRDLQADDFKAALSANGTGITTEHLAQEAAARGYGAFALQLEPAEASAYLAKGRPLIALLSTGQGRHHYVVLLAWANARVLVHDPALGPFRVVSEADWLRGWNATGRWALLVLPGAEKEHVAQAPPPDLEGEDSCASLVQPAVTRALRGEVDLAREDLTRAVTACPDSGAPLRELAGLAFQGEQWPLASRLAEQATVKNPKDRQAWRLLATSRFLEGNPGSALRAWNAIDEPRLDLLRIDGLGRMPFRTAYDYLGFTGGSVLRSDELRRAERRLGALPSVQSSRIGYRPLSDGRAELEAAVLERPRFPSMRSFLVGAAVDGMVDRAIGLEMADLTAAGDTIRLFGRWQHNRPRAALAISTPHALGLPGILTAEVMWDEQSYRMSETPPDRAFVREERRRAAVSLHNWWTADLKATGGVAVDEWTGRGRHLSLASAVERRLFDDRVSLGADLAGWWPTGAGPAFYAGSARASARSSVSTGRRPVVRVDVSYDAASAQAPLALWPGAGTGTGRTLLLRGHALLDDGVIHGPSFGRALVSATVQADMAVTSLGPLKLAAAVFLDSARVLESADRSGPGPVLIDAGAGLRLRLPGGGSLLRLDVATPWGSLHPRVSAGWQAQWPSWHHDAVETVRR